MRKPGQQEILTPCLDQIIKTLNEIRDNRQKIVSVAPHFVSLVPDCIGYIIIFEHTVESIRREEEEDRRRRGDF